MHQRTVGRVMCCLAPAVRRSTLSFRPSFIGCFPIGFLRVFSLWSWGIVEERRLQLQWWESPTFPAQGHRDLLWISCLEFSGFAVCLPRNLLNLFLPSLICDVDPHPIFFLFPGRSWCSDFAAHSILVQDEVLQDTTAGQALRDSWRTAVPNARSLVSPPERLNEEFKNKNRGVYFVFQCCFCVKTFSSPPFFEEED